MAQAMYVTVLYGMRYGPRYSIPLGLMAGFLGATFVSCNRHYTSQIVAGAAFGAMYALAANTLVSAKLTDRVKLGFKFDAEGSPTFSLAFNF
jgi:membrane-associated phospholipid phosphatase